MTEVWASDIRENIHPRFEAAKSREPVRFWSIWRLPYPFVKDMASIQRVRTQAYSQSTQSEVDPVPAATRRAWPALALFLYFTLQREGH